MGEAPLRAWLALGVLLLAACGGDTVPEGCTTPDEGDLEGYCIVGDAHGAAAALDDMATCAGLDEDAPPVSVPPYVAEGPGDCGDDVGEVVLQAEQEAYEGCWQAAYAATWELPEGC